MKYKIIILLIILFIIIHIPRFIIEIKSNFILSINHTEDQYQIKKSTAQNLDQRIISFIYFDMKEIEFEKYIKILKKKLLDFYIREIKEIENHDIIEITNNDIENYNIKGKIIYTIINKKKQIIKSIFNHAYCSGEFFVKYGAIIYDGKLPKYPKYHNYLLIPEILFFKMIINKPYKPKTECLTTNIQSNDIKRVFFKIKIPKIKNISSRTFILWNVLHYLSKIKKKIYNIMIPVPFKRKKYIYNNIGVYFIKWPKEGFTKDELEKEITKQMYSIIPTNLFLKANLSKNKGIETRKNCDLVFSSSYLEDTKIKTKRSFVTFNGVADYGIYCLTSTINNNVDISLTFSTNQFDFDSLIKILPKNHIIF